MLSPQEFDSFIALVFDWLRESSSEGSQLEGACGISYWNDGAYWADAELIRAPRLKRLALWLDRNISLEAPPEFQ
jgi:hypothetical protein